MTRGYTSPLFLLLPLLAGLGGCGDGASKVRAKPVERADELIGGPSAKGKVGDLLLENDQLRAIIAGQGQTWLGNTFGGSLVDLDRVRPSHKQTLYGQGHDSFGETFPLVNLIIPDPAKGARVIETADGRFEVRVVPGGVTVLDDGSGGEQAVVRVRGSGAYLFQAIKFLNRDFLKAMLSEFQLAGMPLPLRDLARQLIDPNLDLFSLLNRLQLDFSFTTDYVVRPGEPYVLIRTTFDVAPPSADTLTACAELRADQKPCALTLADCPGGFSFEEVPGPPPAAGGEPIPLLCPACRCANLPTPLTPITEQRNMFGDMLGDLDLWVSPTWRGGIVGGDFLFFGAQSSIFIPGQGFDDDRRVFENMWQGVGSLASPFVYPWVASTGEAVSYGYTTVNPRVRAAAACTQQRVAVRKIDPAGEEALTQALVLGFGMTAGGAAGLVRGLIVDRMPIPLPVPALLTEHDVSTADFEVWRQQRVARWLADALATWRRTPEEPALVAGLPALDPVAYEKVRRAFDALATLELLPATECQSAQLLVPIFTSSATAVISHQDASALVREADGRSFQDRLTFTWERYLVVGDGDVGSVLETVYALRDEPVGWVQGGVLEDGSSTPVSHAHVFAVRDPQPTRAEPVRFASWESLRQATREAFGNDGILSEMQSDRGLDRVLDGDYRGPLPPGRYYLVAKTTTRRVSRPVPVAVAAGKVAVAHLTLQPAGHLTLRVQDSTGARLPAKAVLVDLDEQGRELPWDGQGHVALGDARFDLGVRHSAFTTDGELELDFAPGSYNLYVSRGLEYSIHTQRLELRPGKPTIVEATLRREVDTRGMISADFHVHAAHSVDGSMPFDERVASAVAEGVEFFTGTDHDALTDYRPYIHDLRVEPWVATQVGVETTTLEFGHFNGYPLRYDATDWSVHDPPPWYGLPTAEVFAGMRARAADPANFVVQVNHPWDGFMGYFAQAGVHGYDLQRATPGMEMCNPQTEQISCDFEAVEVMNEKRFELIRTPTVREVAEHNACYQEILGTHDRLRFVLPAGAAAGDPALARVVCADLQLGPAECAGVDQRLLAAGLTEEARLELLDLQDGCTWAKTFRDRLTLCGLDGTTLLECKRHAIDALKYLSVRRMMLRTPAEQEAFRSLTLARDPDCQLSRATAGCSPNVNAEGKFLAGCGGEDCACETCVCATHPECCKRPTAAGGTGWTESCAAACRDECHSCGVEPCTKLTQMLDSWFSMLNAGFVVTGVGNSDSHNKVKEIGIPRNFVQVEHDAVPGLDPREVNRAVRERRVTASSGPYLEFALNDGQVGDTIVLAEQASLTARLRVQTPSWFGVDRVEIYRNGMLEKRFRLTGEPARIVDFDERIELPRPSEDSWYVAIAYGVNDGNELSPVYNGLIYGHLLIPTVISIGLGQILGGFDSLFARLEEKGFRELLDDALAGLAGGTEMPDSCPTMPFGFTNPIWVDVDGRGFTAPDAQDRDGDGQPDLPPFCSQACAVALDDVTGLPGPATCGENQICQPDAPDSPTGVCTIPLAASCPRDPFGLGSLSLPLAASAAPDAVRRHLTADPPWSATRTSERLLRRLFLGEQH